jgi:hypothetical protein
MIVIAWPNPSYMAIAKEAMETADSLDASPNRLVVINNIVGRPWSSSELSGMLDRNGLGRWPYALFPQLFGPQNATIPQLARESQAAQDALDAILEFIDRVKLG